MIKLYLHFFNIYVLMFRLLQAFKSIVSWANKLIYQIWHLNSKFFYFFKVFLSYFIKFSNLKIAVSNFVTLQSYVFNQSCIENMKYNLL